jgi:hypothetical protein
MYIYQSTVIWERSCGLTISVLDSCAVDRKLDHQFGQIRDNTTDI